ncbi:SGNH/GDSL hydrolase family protein [soil metagenome]
MKIKLLLSAMLLAGFVAPSSLSATEAKPPLLLKKDDKVIIIGDSITEERLYSKFIELYFAACLPELNLRAQHLGWSGATVGGYRTRMDLVLLPAKPNLVTICYGMNDGGYGAFNPTVGRNYKDNLGFVVEAMKNNGAIVLVGSPGAVDTRFFPTAAVYNETLGQLRDVAREVAEAQQQPSVDLHDILIESMAKAKSALGNDYPVCGVDGIHPGPPGSLIMAYAFLKAMGVDGNIGTITIDMKGNATATEGHKVLSSQPGQAEIESTRYPFCFSGGEKLPNGTLSILPFVPFNQDLNRFTLVVKNLESEKAKVTWGAVSKVFTKKELASGINLADVFAAANPFSETFQKADTAVFVKQTLESECKHVIEDINDLTEQDATSAAQLDQVRKKIDQALEKSHSDVRAILVPLKHTLTVTPES